ncbi:MULTISPECIES: cutinase family protein [Cryobacterium]|nr:MULTISPECIES: cutinase family protein [Cryobacterium]
MFIGARGSGEPAETGVGDTLEPTYRALKTQLQAHDKSIGIKAVDYDAIALGANEIVESAELVPGNYTESVRGGTTQLIADIQDLVNECPGTGIVLGGYSQGAQVVDMALDMLTVNNGKSQIDAPWFHESDYYSHLTRTLLPAIAGVALFGDPKFNAGDPADNSSFDENHHGVWLPHGVWSDNIPSLNDRVVSVCHIADPVCNITAHTDLWGGYYYRDTAWLAAAASGLGYATPWTAHENYAQDAARVAVMLTRSLGLVAHPSVELDIPANATDVAYVVDWRTDMWSTSINSVGIPVDNSRRQALRQKLLDQIARMGNRGLLERWGVYEYNAHSGDDNFKWGAQAGETTKMTSNFASVWTDNYLRIGGPPPSYDSGWLDYWHEPSNARYWTPQYDDHTSMLQAIGYAITALNDHQDGSSPTHKKQIVVISDRPNDTAAPYTPLLGEHVDEHFSYTGVVDMLKASGVAVSFWNPFAEPLSKTMRSATPNASTQAEAPLAEGVIPAEQIAAETGGSSESGDEGLASIATQADSAPTAFIRIPTQTTPGSTIRATVINTSGDGTDPIQSSDWTVTDQEGTALPVSVDSNDTISFAPQNGGTYSVAVAITLASGQSASTSSKLVVQAAPTVAPSTPAISGSAIDDSSVEFQWTVVPDTQFYAIYDDTHYMISAVNPVVGDQGAVSWTVNVGAQTGTRHYSIEAINAAGKSLESNTVDVTFPETNPSGVKVDGSGVSLGG